MKESNPKLTPRQQSFLNSFVRLFQDAGEPLHYSEVAKDQGLRDSSAYDMLRVLEQKRLVNCEYLAPKPVAGPGRMNVVFSPTAEGLILVSYFSSRDTIDKQEWQRVETHILQSLWRRDTSEHGILLEELLGGISASGSPLVACARMITALLLCLREMGLNKRENRLISMLLERSTTKIGMSLLAGVAFSLCLAEKVRRRFGHNVGAYVKSYELSLEGLSQEGLIILHRFIRNVWKTLTKVPEQ